jgi:lipopolysaccharide/colanic/teichoic acid biosynthesis glycosyltransferase
LPVTKAFRRHVDLAMKTLFDRIVSAIALVFLAPPLLVLGLWVRLDSKGPVLYRARRVGKDGRLFSMLKFRTMVVGADKGASSTGDDDPRVTAAGRALRRYKLDELPQLINVFRGDMSFVGPRPQVEWIVDLYSPEERALLSVKPGITDFASLRFPNEGEILKGSADPDADYMKKIHPEKVRLGLEYVHARSVPVDLAILVKTVATIFRK